MAVFGLCCHLLPLPTLPRHEVLFMLLLPSRQPQQRFAQMSEQASDSFANIQLNAFGLCGQTGVSYGESHFTNVTNFGKMTVYYI